MEQFEHTDNNSDQPDNGNDLSQSEKLPYRPPRRRIIRSVFSVNPSDALTSEEDDQRRFLSSTPGQRGEHRDWEYRPPVEGRRRAYSSSTRRGEWSGRQPAGERRSRSRFGNRRRSPYVEPADRGRITARPTTIVRALVRLLYCSRRLAKRVINDHVVTVNDRIVREPVYSVRLLYDAVRIDGLLLHHSPRNIYIAINKPRHYVGCREPNVRHLFNFLMKKRGWYIPLGPLVKSVGGLVIVTNDAEQRIPGKSVFDLMEKEYHIKVHKAPAKRTLPKIVEQIESLHPTDKGIARAELIRKTKRYAVLSIVTICGTASDLYRILKEAELEVIAMDRYRIGTITIDNLSPGSWRRLTQIELSKIIPASVPMQVIEPLASEQPWQALYQRWFKST